MKSSKIIKSPVRYLIITILLYILNSVIIVHLPNAIFLEENLVNSIVNFCEKIEPFVRSFMTVGITMVVLQFFANKSASKNEMERDLIINPTNNQKRVKLKAESFSFAFDKIDEVIGLIQNYFTKNNYKKKQSFNYNLGELNIYEIEKIKDFEISISCIAVAKIKEFNKNIVDDIEKEFANYVNTIHKKVDYIELCIIFLVEHQTDYFCEYMGATAKKGFNSCHLGVGIINGENKVHFSNNKSDFNSMKYKSLKNKILNIFMID